MLQNTATRYGSVSRRFHWIIAILVLVDLVLGIIGDKIPRNADTVAVLQVLYSTHKTIGVTVLFLAVFRVLWTLIQTRPVPLHPERRLETFAADTAHWLLYGAIFVLPLSGWVIHSAEVGFAPIWWPFGQNLPFIPKSEAIAETAATVHWMAANVLFVTVLAHIGGALKHAYIDRDNTLARMWRGTDAGTTATAHPSKVKSAISALVIWGLAIGSAVTFLAPDHDTATAAVTAQPVAPASDAVASGWVVQDGDVSIAVQQMGDAVSGSFGSWTANIDYDDSTGTGQVTAVIDTTSLSLGSVTQQAKGEEFFNTATYSQATFEGDIARVDGASHRATGALTLVGQTVPVVLDFDLEITDGLATMTGTASLDRRDFGMGAGYTDESTVGFAVDVTITLTAEQQAP